MIYSPTIHFVKDKKSLCSGTPEGCFSRNTVFGDPKSWPDDHLFIRVEDKENAKEVNCPICRLKGDPNPQLADRLNVSHPEPLPSLDSKGGLRYLNASLEGVIFDVSGLDSSEEKTGQAAHFDHDLGRWHKVG
jgi:hypothetical protein